MKRRLAESIYRIGDTTANPQKYDATDIDNDIASSSSSESDEMFRIHRSSILPLCYCCRRRHIFIGSFLLAAIIAYVASWSLTTLLSSSKQETFSATDSFRRLPDHCRKIASRLDYCQTSRPLSKGIVIACHQTWCNRWGHCELCSGIGDRTRFLMSLIQDALEQCIPFQIDSPQAGLAMREDVVYRDRLGLFAELFHYRSYDVTDHHVNILEWSPQHSMHHNNQTTASGRTNPIFVHMTPNNYVVKSYDPCLLRILFRPSQSVQRQLDSQMSAMTAQTTNLIGIHFRSGDFPAFGLTDYKDSRVVNLESALEKMMQCALELSKRLLPESSSLQNQPVAFFFATDHRDAKRLVKRKYSNHMTIYTTDVIPQNYRKRNEDVQAWLEIWILSKMKGLVMNVVPKEYVGTAGYVSFFSLLAANLGFMKGTQILPCD